MPGTFMGGRLLYKACYAAATALSLFLCGEGFALQDTEALEEQRRAFQSARYALQKDDLTSYKRIEPFLVTYPLYPYLRYEYLRSRFGQAKPEEIRTFLIQFPDTPLAPQLRRAWLVQLARQGRWKQYLEDYGELPDPALRCHYANALVQTGRKEAAWQEIENLWLSGRPQPDECNAPFAAWRNAGKLTQQKVLARMELAMDQGESRLVSHLAESLPKSDIAWVKRWERLRRSPAAELKHLSADDRFWSARLYTYGVRRLSGQDAQAADLFWSERAKYDLSPEQVQVTERAVAMNLAMQRHPQGSTRLTALTRSGLDDTAVRQWAVRAALWQRDWPQVLTALDTMTTQEQSQGEWTYWRARALEALGRKKEAAVFYHVAAAERSFHGFLAAHLMNRAPNIASEPLPVTEAELATMKESLPIQRVRELSELGMTIEARREWRDATARMTARSLRVAAKVANDWGWYDQAIVALGRSDYLDDLEIRFPTPYKDEVHTAAKRRNLDPAFVYAVMRQESAFGVKARSPVGALGLMQLMPATAKQTARSLKEKAPSQEELLQADTNILLGTAYLRGLLEQYDGNRFFTLAAYNAGPHRVSRWQPATDPMPADIWVANITFGETREYVQRILTYTAVYEWRLGRSITPLANWLSDAPPRNIREASSGDNKEEEGMIRASLPPT